MINITYTAPATSSTTQSIIQPETEASKPLDTRSIGESTTQDTYSIASNTYFGLRDPAPVNTLSRIKTIPQSPEFKAFKGKARASLLRKGDSLALLAGFDKALKVTRTDSKLACTLKLGDTTYSKIRAKELLDTSDNTKSIEHQKRDFNRVLSDLQHGLAHDKNLRHDEDNKSVLNTLITGLAQHPEYLNKKLLIHHFSTFLKIATTLQNTGEADAANKAIFLCETAVHHNKDPLEISHQSIELAQFKLTLDDIQGAQSNLEQASHTANLIDYPTNKASKLKAMQKELSAKTNSFAMKYDMSPERPKCFQELEQVNNTLELIQKADYNEIKSSTLMQIATLKIQTGNKESALQDLNQAGNAIQAIQSPTKKTSEFKSLAMLKIKIGDNDGALEALMQANSL